MQPVAWLPEYISFPLYSIYLNQSLIAGLIALCAALLTVKAIREQIDQAEKAELERLRRRNRAARASLTFALSEFVQYTDMCLTEISVVESARQQSLPVSRALTLPTYPVLAVAKIAEATETADAINSKRLASILAFGQIYHARLAEFVKASNLAPYSTSQRDCNNRYFDTLCLRKLCARAFDYGRGRTETIGEVCTSTDAIQEVRVKWGFSNPNLETIIQQRWPPDFHDFAHDLEDW